MVINMYIEDMYIPSERMPELSICAKPFTELLLSGTHALLTINVHDVNVVAPRLARMDTIKPYLTDMVHEGTVNQS